MQQKRFLGIVVIIGAAMLGGLMSGCGSSTPPAAGTDGGRQIDDGHADDSRFDPNGFMSGFEGSPSP